MRNLAETLRALAPERVLESEPMSRHTTFRVGGPAELMFLPASAGELTAALDAARSAGAPVHLVGNGSNLIVRDGGLRGLTIVMGEPFSSVRVVGSRVIAQAGAPLARVAAVAHEAGLTGLEFASGIPGTLGGGCAMNAGAYGGELKDVLESAVVLHGGQLSDVIESALVLLDGTARMLGRDELEMGYRSTRVLREGGIVLEARFALAPDDPAEIAARMRELNARRREKQPLNLPSAGSTFKRPEGHFAGALIEGCGLKGARVGGAQVSEKHAGFIVNAGGATAADILALMARVRETVLRETGVELEPEVRIIGED